MLRLWLLAAAVPAMPGPPAAGAVPAPQAAGGDVEPDAHAVAALRSELQRALERLAALRSARDGAANAQTAQLRAASRLVALLGARVEAAALAPEPVASPQPLALTGSPPYATADVDSLRDQLDSLDTQRAALRPLLAGLQASRQDAAAALRKAAETLRLRREQAERAGGDEAIARMRADLELATVQHRVAEFELERIDRAIQTAQARLGALGDAAAPLAKRLAAARAQHHIDDDVLAAVRRDAQARRGAIAAQRDALESALQPSGLAPTRPDDAARREAQWSRDALASLPELDTVVAARESVWQQRRAALAAHGIAPPLLRHVIGSAVEPAA